MPRIKKKSRFAVGNLTPARERSVHAKVRARARITARRRSRIISRSGNVTIIMVMLLRSLSSDRKRHYVLSRRLRRRIIRRRKTLNANVCGALDYHKRDGNEDLTLCAVSSASSDYLDARAVTNRPSKRDLIGGSLSPADRLSDKPLQRMKN